MSDRRREPRFTPEQPVPAEVRATRGPPHLLTARAVDLSGGGLCLHFEGRCRLREDQEVLVRLSPEDDEPELIEATVRRVGNGVIHLQADILTHDHVDDPRQLAWSGV